MYVHSQSPSFLLVKYAFFNLPKNSNGRKMLCWHIAFFFKSRRTWILLALQQFLSLIHTACFIWLQLGESFEIRHRIRHQAGHGPILFIQCDFSSYNVYGQTASVAGTTLTESIDILFKWLWVFYVKYLTGLQVFHKFWQRCTAYLKVKIVGSQARC
jgi:hypothetical protein